MLKVAKVSPYQQKTSWTCSAACLRAVLLHYGEDVSELDAGLAIRTRRKRGAEVTDIVEGARRLGFEAFDWCFTMESAEFLTSQDIPIICDIQSFNYPGKGHYVVLTRIDGEATLMDPNTPGNSRVISRNELEERWWDRTMESPHDIKKMWGIVVLPKQGPDGS